MSALRVVGALVFCWLVGVVSAQSAPRCADDVPWQGVAPGVWSWSPPAEAEIAPANAGHVLPTSVVVHGGQALLIDPGPSNAHGQRVRRSLACRFGAQVRWIVNTHAHAENVLGNSAFADRVAAGTVQILASAATRAGMAQRCPDCLASLTTKAGANAMAGTRIVLPTRTLAEGDVLRVGPYRMKVQRIEQGHTDGDLVLWDAQRRLLWTGGLVYGQRLPELAQGSLEGWLAALDRLAALRPRVVVGNVVSAASDVNTSPPAASRKPSSPPAARPCACPSCPTIHAWSTPPARWRYRAFRSACSSWAAASSAWKWAPCTARWAHASMWSR